MQRWYFGRFAMLFAVVAVSACSGGGGGGSGAAPPTSASSGASNGSSGTSPSSGTRSFALVTVPAPLGAGTLLTPRTTEAAIFDDRGEEIDVYGDTPGSSQLRALCLCEGTAGTASTVMIDGEFVAVGQYTLGNSSSYDPYANSISVYPPGGQGKIHATRTIYGNQTLLGGARSISSDGFGRLYSVGPLSANVPYVDPYSNGETVNVYAADANGNASPIAQFQASNARNLEVVADPKDNSWYVIEWDYLPRLEQTGPTKLLTFAPVTTSGLQTPVSTVNLDSSIVNGSSPQIDPQGIAISSTASDGSSYITVVSKAGGAIVRREHLPAAPHLISAIVSGGPTIRERSDGTIFVNAAAADAGYGAHRFSSIPPLASGDVTLTAIATTSDNGGYDFAVGPR